MIFVVLLISVYPNTKTGVRSHVLFGCCRELLLAGPGGPQLIGFYLERPPNSATPHTQCVLNKLRLRKAASTYSFYCTEQQNVNPEQL